MGPLPQTLHPHPSYPSWLCGLFPLRDSHQIIDAPTPLFIHLPPVVPLAWQGALDNSLKICDRPSVLGHCWGSGLLCYLLLLGVCSVLNVLSPIHRRATGALELRPWQSSQEGSDTN